MRGLKGQLGRIGQIGAILIIAVLAPRAIFAVGADGADSAPNAVRLTVGRSTVIDVGTTITRVSLTSADIADALVTSPSQLLVNGKTPGTISMFVWDRGGAIRRYEVVVQRDLSHLVEQIHRLFPGEPISVSSNGKDVVLSGAVTSKDVMDKAASLAAGYVEKKEDVVNLLTLQDAGMSNQVLLRVRFAEVSRSAMTEFGVGYFTSPTGVKNNIGRITTEQFPAPGFQDMQYTKPDANWGTPPSSATGKFTFSDFLNLFLFNEKYDLGTAVQALQSRGLFQSLAEPNLVAESGKEASFLAGGEFPIPIAQPGGAGVAITIVFKEFGIRLNFTPTVTADRIHLKVRPEVSTLDFTNAITLQGFRIPALSTRRTETELELRDGQTFAIAGLLNNQVNQTLQKIPGIGDIPILGQLFRSRAAQKDQTELVVMITPQILPRNSNGVTPNLPRLQEPFLSKVPDKKTHEAPAPAFAPGGTASAAPSIAPVPAQRATAPANGTTSPADAAAAVTALTPKARTVVSADAQPAPEAAPNAAPAQPEQKSPAQIRHEAQSKAQAKSAQPSAAQIRAQAEQQKAAEKAAGEQLRRDKAEQERQARIAAEQQKKQAEIDRENARRAGEQARKQKELDKKQQKTIAEAEAKLKAAEAAYQAELAKKQKQEQPQ